MNSAAAAFIHIFPVRHSTKFRVKYALEKKKKIANLRKVLALNDLLQSEHLVNVTLTGWEARLVVTRELF